MKNKKKAEVSGFCKHRNIKSFFDSFDSNLSKKNYQCFNCEDWKPGHKLVPVYQFDEMTKEVFGMRFCRACWQSYQDVSPELKKEFIDRIRNKVKKVSGVKA